MPIFMLRSPMSWLAPARLGQEKAYAFEPGQTTAARRRPLPPIRRLRESRARRSACCHNRFAVFVYRHREETTWQDGESA
jgi:hypothetical protein